MHTLYPLQRGLHFKFIEIYMNTWEEKILVVNTDMKPRICQHCKHILKMNSFNLPNN